MKESHSAKQSSCTQRKDIKIIILHKKLQTGDSNRKAGLVITVNTGLSFDNGARVVTGGVLFSLSSYEKNLLKVECG